MRSRQPKQLLLAFLGEHVVDQDELPLRASVLIEVLEGAGVAAPATRATLDRMVRRGLVARERRGREIRFTLTSEGSAVLREAVLVGAAAELIGPTVGVDEVAAAAGTISYEILTGLGRRLVREYVEND